MLIFSYQILIALGTSHNAAISKVLRFQYAGVIAASYKAKIQLFTSQVMAAFQSAMFDSKQAARCSLQASQWTNVWCFFHLILFWNKL